MEPRSLDTSSAPLRDGWTTEQAGQWQGHEVELVYDPRRHDVMLVQTEGESSTHPLP
jgi:hypothetical protein